mgnify:CR=1 FL=1
MPNIWPCVIVFVLFFLNIPVAYAMLFSSFVYFTFWCDGVNMFTMVSSLFSQAESFTMLAVPLFIMAGSIMGYGGISTSLMDFCDLLTGNTHGGLGHANILLSTFMGGISGSPCADAAFESRMLVPEMRKRGMTLGYSAAVTACSSCITPIIPPGICLIIYATASGVSIGDMFMAGYIPGLIICVSLLVVNFFISKRRGYPCTRERKPTAREFGRQAAKSAWALVLPLGIIMGLRLGWFTPTECAGVTVFYALFAGIFVYKQLKPDHFKKIIVETVSSTSNVLLILSAAALFSRYMVWENIPQTAATYLGTIATNKYTFLLIVFFFMLFLGMFLDTAAALVILPPLLLPVAKTLGVDPVHLGIVMCLMDTVGGVTPPFGVMMFTVMSVTKVTVRDYLKEGWPLLAALFVVALLCTLVPGISLFLVGV